MRMYTYACANIRAYVYTQRATRCVKMPNWLEGPKIQSCIGAGPKSERSEPCERSEACSERSDEACDCKLHITQTKDCP